MLIAFHNVTVFTVFFITQMKPLRALETLNPKRLNGSVNMLSMVKTLKCLFFLQLLNCAKSVLNSCHPDYAPKGK